MILRDYNLTPICIRKVQNQTNMNDPYNVENHINMNNPYNVQNHTNMNNPYNTLQKHVN